MEAEDRTKFWRDHVNAMASQDKGARAYALEHRLKQSTLEWWRRKLREADRRQGKAAAAPTFIPVRVTAAASAVQPSTTASGAVATIRIGEIAHLELRELPPVQWLAALRHALLEPR